VECLIPLSLVRHVTYYHDGDVEYLDVGKGGMLEGFFGAQIARTKIGGAMM
jgi:hypothetical protein